jgi:hypothetical protein
VSAVVAPATMSEPLLRITSGDDAAAEETARKQYTAQGTDRIQRLAFSVKISVSRFSLTVFDVEKPLHSASRHHAPLSARSVSQSSFSPILSSALLEGANPRNVAPSSSTSSFAGSFLSSDSPKPLRQCFSMVVYGIFHKLDTPSHLMKDYHSAVSVGIIKVFGHGGEEVLRCGGDPDSWLSTINDYECRSYRGNPDLALFLSTQQKPQSTTLFDNSSISNEDGESGSGPIIHESDEREGSVAEDGISTSTVLCLTDPPPPLPHHLRPRHLQEAIKQGSCRVNPLG